MPIELVDTNPAEPARILIYSEGGLGKTTLLARADKPVIAAVEKGASRATDKNGNPVKMFRGIDKWPDLFDVVKWLRHEKHDFLSFGIDSATEIERLAHQQILMGQPGKSIITVDKGYGAGDKRSGSMHKELIAAIEDLRINRGMHILVTGHAKVKTAKDPAMVEDYDTFEPKFQTAEPMGIWKEYVDATIFVRVKTFLKTDDNAKARALTDGSRIALTTMNPAWYAKNRYGFPPEMDFTFEFWETIRPYLERGPVQQTQQLELSAADHIALYQEIIQLISDVPSEETQKVIMQNVKENENNTAHLQVVKQRLLEMTGKKGA